MIQRHIVKQAAHSLEQVACFYTGLAIPSSLSIFSFFSAHRTLSLLLDCPSFVMTFFFSFFLPPFVSLIPSFRSYFSFFLLLFSSFFSSFTFFFSLLIFSPFLPHFFPLEFFSFLYPILLSYMTSSNSILNLFPFTFPFPLFYFLHCMFLSCMFRLRGHSTTPPSTNFLLCL